LVNHDQFDNSWPLGPLALEQCFFERRCSCWLALAAGRLSSRASLSQLRSSVGNTQEDLRAIRIEWLSGVFAIDPRFDVLPELRWQTAVNEMKGSSREGQVA
jgi:hypothetical protein